MDKILVSVVIPTYNAEKYVERCIESVRAQTYKNIEIIIVDDCSPDSTVSYIKSNYPDFRVIENELNQGVAPRRTQGLMACKGQYLAFLDADDYWHPEFVKTTINFLEKNPEAIAVSTAYTGISLKGEKGVPKPKLDKKDIEFYGDEGRICSDFFSFWSKYFGVLTGTVMMRSDVAKQTQGQRTELRLTQDLEFWGYLSTFGKWGFIPKSLFITDPGILLPSDRLKKIKKRYKFFAELNINEWSVRIDTKIKLNEQKSFNKILNHIKTTIAIANAYTFQYKKSYNLVSIWKSDLEAGLGGVLSVGHNFGKLIWPLVCTALRVREIFKSYTSHFLRVIKKSVPRNSR